MHKRLRNKLLLLLVAFLLLAPVSGAQAGMDTPLHHSYLNIADQAQLAQGVYWSNSQNDRVTENYIEYIPNDLVKPVVAYGNYIYGGNRITAVQSVMAGRGYHVVAGLNGDYFHTGTIVPLSTVIEDGVLKGSEGSSWASIGFYEDGRAMISRMNLSITVNINGADYMINKLNKEFSSNEHAGMQLFTSDYATTTRANVASYAVILEQPSSRPAVNQTVTAYVARQVEASGAVDIPAGSMVLLISQNTENTVARDALLSLTPGQMVELNFRGSEAWSQVRYGVGGGEKLITNGVIESHSTSAAPRSALGVRADGSFIMYSVDGRQSGYSVGASLTEVAQRLLALGCVEAVNLDGGGSTTLSAVYPGQSELSTINKPSDGNLRTCANYILLVHQQSATNIPYNLHLYPFDIRILAGSSTEFEMAATDQYYLPAPMPSGQATYYTDGVGTVDDNGRFTAGMQGGQGHIFAEINGVRGQVNVTVVTQPDSLHLIYAESGQAVGSAIHVDAGGTVALSIEGTHDRLPVIADAGACQWSMTGDIGTIDALGRITAYNDIESGSGMVTAVVGNRTLQVPVTISSRVELLEDFESLSQQVGAGWSLAQNGDKAYVRYGNYSGSVNYDFLMAGEDASQIPDTISVSLNKALVNSPSSLDFWLYGDGSANQISFAVQLADGQTQQIPATTLTNKSWQFLSLVLPEGATQLVSLEISRAAGGETGVFYLDQMMVAYGVYQDTTPPTVEIALVDRSLQAVVSDTQDALLSAARIKVYYDGKALTFNYDAVSKQLTATLPEADGKPHRLSITVQDLSGNIGRGAIDVLATEEQAQPFADMNGHWATQFTTYLYQQGIVNGIDSNGKFSYAPDTNMNRAQFAVIMCNWLGVNKDQYASVQLPFADAGEIADWALPSVKAMYALGVTKGSAQGEALYFYPASAISRAEAMTMIGRTQERGYAEVALTFADSASVPAWALPYIKTLVAQGVISGMGDNQLAPSASVTRAQVAKMLYSLI